MEKKEKKEKKGKKRSELETAFYLAVVAAIAGVAYYFFVHKGAASGSVASMIPQCGCAKEWEPVCAAVQLPADWESHLPSEQVEKIKEMQHPRPDGGEPGMPPPMRFPYPNECEARCGGQHDFEKGLCPGTRPAFKCFYEKDCLQLPKEDVCWFGFPFDNACFAECTVREEYRVEYKPEDLVHSKCEDPCKTASCPKGRMCVNRQGPAFAPESPPFKCMDLGCNCAAEWNPACALGITYTNECFAKCEGYGTPDLPYPLVPITPGECVDKDPGYPNAIPFPKPPPKRQKKPAGKIFGNDGNAPPPAPAPPAPAADPAHASDASGR